MISPSGKHRLVRIEVLTAVAIKNSSFWDITPKVNQPFGGTYSLHLQDLRMNQTRNPREAHRKQSSALLYASRCFLDACL
jgi:hypothetical protein